MYTANGCFSFICCWGFFSEKKTQKTHFSWILCSSQPTETVSFLCFFLSSGSSVLTYRQWYIMWHSARCLSVIKRLLCGKRMSHSTQHGFHYPVVIQSPRIGTSGVKHLCEERGWGVYSNVQRMLHFCDDRDSARLKWPTHLFIQTATQIYRYFVRAIVFYKQRIPV